MQNVFVGGEFKMFVLENRRWEKYQSTLVIRDESDSVILVSDNVVIISTFL